MPSTCLPRHVTLRASPLIHALKFYDLARAPDSLFRVGQDLVDQFISKRDFDGALNMMETIVLPQLRQWKLADHMITVRSQYAVVLPIANDTPKLKPRWRG
jgi:hypothetical protein